MIICGIIGYNIYQDYFSKCISSGIQTIRYYDCRVNGILLDKKKNIITPQNIIDSVAVTGCNSGM